MEVVAWKSALKDEQEVVNGNHFTRKALERKTKGPRAGGGAMEKTSGVSHGGCGGRRRERCVWGGPAGTGDGILEPHPFRTCSFSPFSICRSRSFMAA